MMRLTIMQSGSKTPDHDTFYRTHSDAVRDLGEWLLAPGDDFTVEYHEPDHPSVMTVATVTYGTTRYSFEIKEATE